MSVKLMSRVWECDFEHPEQSVMLALADHADDDGSHVFPSIGRIAWKTGYSERQVQRIIRGLQATDVLVFVRRGGRSRGTEYKIELGKATRKPDFVPTSKGDNVTPITTIKGDIPDIKGDISEVKGDAILSPEPSIESSEGIIKEGASAPAPATPLKPKHKAIKNKSEPQAAPGNGIPPAIRTWQTVRHAFPPREAWPAIEVAVGQKDDDLVFWHDVLVAYALMGWNRQSVTGPLDYFKRRELPVNRNGATNGTRRTATTYNTASQRLSRPPDD